jgi:DNA invertase Pin-like site-specific DNA recombinase
VHLLFTNLLRFSVILFSKTEDFPLNQEYAYARISDPNQHIDRQLIAFEPFNLPKENIFIEKKSGKDFNRKQYRRLVRKLKPGDLLIVKELDRLGRNYLEIIEQWGFITKKKGADILVLDMPLLDTRQFRDTLGTLISDIVLSVMSYVAQTEREKMLVRQAEGIAAAKVKGVVFGPKPKALPEIFTQIYAQWKCGEFSSRQVAAHCGVTRSTVYEWEKKLLAEQGA